MVTRLGIVLMIILDELPFEQIERDHFPIFCPRRWMQLIDHEKHFLCKVMRIIYKLHEFQLLYSTSC